MKALDELLIRWQDGSIAADELSALLEALAGREGRARLVDDFLMTASIVETLKKGRAAAPAVRVVPFPAWRSVGPARGWRLSAIAAAVLLGLGALFAARFRALPPLGEAAPAVAVLQKTHGSVLLVRRGASSSAVAGRRLVAGDTLKTGTLAGTATLECGDKVSLALREDTEIEFKPGMIGPPGVPAPNGAGSLFVARGTLRAGIAPLGAGQSVLFETPHTELVVRGTQFDLRVSPEATKIDMLEGTVDVLCKASQESVSLATGFRALVAHNVVVTETPVFVRPGTSPGQRGQHGPVVLYTFREGRGRTIRDVSRAGRPLDLTIRDPGAVSWLPAGGLQVRAATAIAANGSAAKLIEACQDSNEITVEAWVKPANTTQDGPARIVSLAKDVMHSNFTLGQSPYRDVCPLTGATWGPCYTVRLQTTDPLSDTLSDMITLPGSVEPRPTHLTFARGADGAVHFYVNAQDKFGAICHFKHFGTDVQTRIRGGDFSTWAPDHAFMLANQNQGRRPWLGEFYLVAVYNRALTPEEVLANFNAGPYRAAPAGPVARY